MAVNPENKPDDPYETVDGRYKKCRLLNTIQHIDIYGKFRSNYVENKCRTTNDVTMSAVSSCSPKFIGNYTGKGLELKLSKFSVSTKVSGLYPGHDILSKRTHKTKAKKNDFIFGTVMLR